MELLNINPRRNECVIVATFNALQWTGRPTSYLEIKEVAKSTYGFNKKIGTPSENISPMLKYFGVPYKEIKIGTSLVKLLKIISRGNAVLICYNYKGSKNGHMAMITPRFTVVNPDRTLPTWNHLFEALFSGKLLFNAWVLK